MISCDDPDDDVRKSMAINGVDDVQNCMPVCVPVSSPISTLDWRSQNDQKRDQKRKERIILSRGAFKWLPIFCSNDLVHGSWWFVWGSVFGTIISIFPLCSDYIPFFRASATTLPALELPSTWGLLISSGVFFTLGSLAFVRAFEDPPLPPLFHAFYHLSTDELLGAWLYLLGTIPAVPYAAVCISHDPSQLVYWGGLFASVCFVICTSIFVVVSYPSAKGLLEPSIQPFAQRVCGNADWIHRHLATDWLAATWCFLYVTLLWFVASLVLLWVDCVVKNGEEMFIWTSSVLDALFFLVGCVYFVAGSYPLGSSNMVSSNYDHWADNSTHSQHMDQSRVRSRSPSEQGNIEAPNEAMDRISTVPLSAFSSIAVSQHNPLRNPLPQKTQQQQQLSDEDTTLGSKDVTNNDDNNNNNPDLNNQ